MTAIEVARFRTRCSTQERDRTLFAIEDSLRTAIPDDRRLVLVRRMQVVGRVSSLQPALRNAAVRDGWLAAISGGRHGGEDGAADANCVWFASREEAEALLLSRLLAGRSVDAWYWQLALPNWRGRPLDEWVWDCLCEAIGSGQNERILSLSRCFIAAGASDRLIEIVARPEGGRTGGIAAPNFGAPWSITALHTIPPLAAEAAHWASDFAAAMPSELRQMIASLVRAGGEARTMAGAMVQAWVLKQSPAIALSRALLTEIVSVILDRAVSQRALLLPPTIAEMDPGLPDKGRTRRSAQDQPASGFEDFASHERTQLQPNKKTEVEGARRDGSGAEMPQPQVTETALHRRHSAHAGLWLAIPSLIELGFREWLSQRPELLCKSPARQLIYEIARHHRVEADDPALAVLGAIPNPDVRPEWARQWRHGLDRWLRHTVRRRLHDLVNRAGEILWDELRLVVRYPPAEADIALRRRALDRDPGWVDWLGLSVRYDFGGSEDWV